MNNRYLFKAKRIDNGEWVEGDLIHAPDGRMGIITEDDLVTVMPDTLCQCTGLTDKNRNLIWENDICIIRDGNIDEEDGYFRLDWEDERAMFEFEGTGLCINFDNICGYECEVAGNVFDNPELLEVEE